LVPIDRFFCPVRKDASLKLSSIVKSGAVPLFGF
jgi:hypothetical protein